VCHVDTSQSSTIGRVDILTERGRLGGINPACNAEQESQVTAAAAEIRRASSRVDNYSLAGLEGTHSAKETGVEGRLGGVEIVPGVGVWRDDGGRVAPGKRRDVHDCIVGVEDVRCGGEGEGELAAVCTSWDVGEADGLDDAVGLVGIGCDAEVGAGIDGVGEGGGWVGLGEGLQDAGVDGCAAASNLGHWGWDGRGESGKNCCKENGGGMHFDR
jgi:hypothetical protein